MITFIFIFIHSFNHSDIIHLYYIYYIYYIYLFIYFIHFIRILFKPLVDIKFPPTTTRWQ